DTLAEDCHLKYDAKTKEELEALGIKVKVAGRMMAKRIMGKASFTQLQDMSGKIQLFLQRDALPEGVYNEGFKKWDVGDIVGGEGVLFKTKTDELSVKVTDIKLLTKALRPLPEKFHGLSDQETRYRQRYLDLIINQQVRETFQLRSKIISYIRRFFEDRGFMDVETPMLQAIPGGATARPFETFHNALDMPMFMRIAPELYLKRLVVGGFEKVFEINRNFRNEGVSTRHNPEFTMLEFYQSYADYNDLMDITEALLHGLARDVVGNTNIEYQGDTYDFSSQFARMSVFDSILHFNPALTAENINTAEAARKVAQDLHIPLKDSYGLGKVQIEIFEKTVEHRLMNPTFITQYPT
ncbi:Lysyl-tRNA synthetase (class II), partial [hydrothermal vent metagenome]